MTNQILSFEEMLEREEYVLVDTSVHESASGWFKDGVYPVSSFSGIDEELLISKRDGLKYFVSFLEEPRTYTSQGVSLELERARDMVEFKISRLEEIKHDYFSKELSNRGTSKKRLKRRSHSPNEREVPQEKLLREIQDLYYKSFVQARRSVLPVLESEQELYDTLENLVVNVAENTDSKIDLKLSYGDSINENKVDFHTDEQLVSLALYLSMGGYESCIMTRDSDFRRILMNTFGYISNPEASHAPEGLLESIGENGIRIYFFSSGDGKLVLDTSEVKSASKLPLREIEGINQALDFQE